MRRTRQDQVPPDAVEPLDFFSSFASQEYMVDDESWICDLQWRWHTQLGLAEEEDGLGEKERVDDNSGGLEDGSEWWRRGCPAWVRLVDVGGDEALMMACRCVWGGRVGIYRERECLIYTYIYICIYICIYIIRIRIRITYMCMYMHMHMHMCVYCKCRYICLKLLPLYTYTSSYYYIS